MNKRILVVEDQDDLRAILRNFFAASCYAVIEAERRQGGFGTPRSRAHGHPDAVLDGYDATRQIKALPGCASVPIIAVSSFAMRGDEEKARAAGWDHYVTKLYSTVHLLRILRGFLDERV